MSAVKNSVHPMVAHLYRFCWGNNSKRETLKGRVCKVVTRGAKRSALIEFIDNKQRELVDRYALRKH